MLKGRATHSFDGTASLLLPLVAAQLQGTVNIGFSVIGAQDEQSAGKPHMEYKNYSRIYSLSQFTIQTFLSKVSINMDS